MRDEQKCGQCIIAWDGSFIPCEEHKGVGGAIRNMAPFIHEGFATLPQLPELPELTAQLDAIAIPRRKTGVIVGSATDSAEHCHRVKTQLQRMFPEVRIAVVPHAQSVAFEWEVDA